MQSTRKPFFTGSVVGVGLGRFVFATATLTAMASGALAGPEGAQVVRGNATINQAGAITTIQAGNNAIINYQRFNIGTGETVRFVQPNATSRVLNRVTGGDPTQINGSLFSNGIVYISNPSGIFFGGRAIVSVGGLTAAAGTITNDDFLRGNDRFTGVSGAVVNNGTIEAGLGGSVNLIGQYVSNHGNIVVEAGTVTMTAGDEVYVGRRDGGLMVRVSKTTAAGDRAGVENSGSIRAAASMLTAGDMYSLAIKNTGTIRSKSVTLEGKGSGVVHVAGTIDARGGAGGGAGERGGDVTITGEKVGLFGATIDASGATGGDVRIGGDYQGRGDLRRADATYVSADSSIRADGGAGSAAAGAGGRVILWSEDYTNFMGTISARGGAQGGHGGFAEVSSRQVLAFRGTADLRADRGNAGMLLLDPNNLTIQAAGATTNVSNTAGVFETTADSAILTVSDLVTQLGLSAVTVQTADQVGSTEAGNITVADAITAPANSNSLTLLAHNDILLNADIDFSASTGDVVLRADGVSSNGVGRIDASGGGTIIMGGGGLALTAGSGVGSAAAPVTTTDVTTLAGASATGGVFVSETNSPGMTIGTVAGTSGLASTTSGNIQIVSSAGLITIAQPVSSAGQLLFQAANGVTFNANASSAGIFRVFADSDTNGAGTLVVADGVTLTSGLEFTGDAGDVNLNATGAITVTGLTSNLLLRPSMPTLTIGLGGAAGDFNLVGTELDSLTPGTSGQVDIGFAASVGGNATINSFTFPFSLVVRGDNVEVAAAQTLTLSGSARRLTLIGADIDLNGGIAAGANEVVMRAPGAADAMDLGVGAPTATFILTNADLNNITSSGNVRIGLGASTGSGAVTIGTVALAGGSAYSLDVRGGATTIGSLTTQNNATINASTGDVTVGSISSGASSVSVTSVAGSILDNAVDNSADVTTTGAVTLAAATAIGGAGSTIDLDVGTVALASATTGGVFLSLLDGNSSGVAITSVAAGNTVLINSPGGVAGAFTITSVSSGAGSTTITNSGNVVLGTIGAAGQAVSVTSTAGSIIDDGTQGTRVTAGTATFTANAGAVGATGNGDIDTDTSTSVAATSGAGGVFIREANSLTIAGLTTTNNGNAFLATDAGDIGQSAAVTVAGVTTFNAAGGLADVLFGTQINSFGAVGGVQVTARDGFVRGSGGVRIGTSNVTRDLTVTATTGNITDNGVVTVGRGGTFTTLANNATILLDQLAVSAVGGGAGIALNTVGAAASATIVNVGDVALRASDVGGDLSVTSTTGSMTDSGTVTVRGDASFRTLAANEDIDLNLLDVRSPGTIALFTAGLGGNATITNATAVNLDESMVGGNLRATAATGNVTDAGTITVGGDAAFTASNANDDIVVNQLVVAGAVSVTTSGATGNATVVDNGPLDLGASSVGGNLTATAALGALTDSGTVAVGGNATFVAAQANADILLNQLAVAPTGLVSVTTSGANGDATIVNANSLVLGTSSVGRDFVVEATNGTVTDMGVSTVTGSMSLLANGAGGGVTADQIAVGGAILCNTSGSASITNTTEVRFSGSIIGDLMLTASSGRVVSNGSTSVGGMTMLTATGAGGAIDMTGLNATGSVGLNTIGNATVTNQQALDLKASSIGGDLAATATAGGITDSGAVAVTGATTLTASGTGGTINVNQIASVGGFSLNSSDDATITTAGAMQLNTSTVGGDLAATATTGTITDTGTIAVTGMTTLNAIGAGGAINVDQLASTGAVGLNTIGNATVVNAGALDLKASTVGMDLSATSTNGGITDSGTVTVAGNAAFNAASGISDANLDTLAIAGQVFLSIARDAFITNASDLTLGLGTVGRNLNATATTGILTDGDVLTVGGTASFATQATGALINLDQLAVAGTISLSTVGMMGSATIVNATGVELGSVTVGGDLRVTATTGNITDTGLVVAQGDATFATLEPSGQIDLDQTTMQPGRSLSLITTGGNARVTHVGSLTLGASGVGGDLTVTATGGVNQTAAISVNGATTINGSSSPVFDVNLSNPSNDFVGAVSVANASSIQISDANDLTLGEMSASGDTTLNAGGRLLDDGIAGTRVGGNLVTLNAGTGMGDATNRVQTRATNLVINAGTGDAFVGEADAVTLDSASASGQTVNLQYQSGDMTIDNDISGHYSLALETLDGDLNINSDVMLAGDSITNAGGNFTAHSSRNLTILGTINTSGFAGFASAGDIDLASGFASTTNSQFNIELPTYLLTINGDLLASGAGGDISLNSIAGMTRAVPGTATILIQRISPAALPDAQGNLTTRIEGASVTMGQNEKVVALGNLNFGTQASPMASATLGDVSVLGDLGVYANSITILRRDQSNLLTRSQTGLLSSTQDLGTDVVAGGQITLLSAAIGGGIGGGGITFSDSDADVANAGGFDVRKYGSGTTTISRQSFGIDPNTNMPTRIDGVDVFLDLTAQGPGQTNVAEIIAGAVPKEQGGEVSEAAGLDSGQKAKLKQLGIDPRDLTDPRALLAMLAGRALYDDYPAFGGRDVQYQVTVNRLPTPVVEDVLRAYEAVYSKPVIDPDTGQQAVDPQTGQPMTTSRATDIQQIFRASYDRYGEVAQDFEPTAFAEYIRTNPAETEAAQTLEQLRTFFARVDRLGLGPRERSIVRGVLLNYIKPQQLRAPGVMETVVFGSPNT